MKRRGLVLLLIALGAAASCSRRAHRPVVKDTVYRHLESDPATLDPIVTNEELGLRVEEMIFRPLVGIDRDRRFVPGLAQSWSASSDGLVYDFRLDPSARWEDGSPVTSADVAYTIDLVRDPKVAAVNWRWGFEDAVAVETPDAQSVLVRFRRPYAERLLAFNLPVVAASSAPRRGEAGRKPFGTGPYRLESWEPNQKLTLLRRPDAPASVAFSRIVFRIIPDAAVRLQAGTRGDLDEFKINRDQRAGAARSPEFTSVNQIWKVPYPSVSVLIWNLRNPLFADPRVRLALAHAWPRADAARQLYPPDGAALLTGPYLAGSRESAPGLPPPSYDPGLAGRMLDEAGYPRGADGARRSQTRRVAFEVLYPAGYPIYANIAEILRGSYEKIGVQLTQRALDWAAYTQRVAAGEFDSEIGGTLLLPPKADLYAYYHSSQAPPNGENFGSYHNPDADRLMEQAQREMEDGRRLDLYRQIARLLAADPPADFLWSTDQYWGVSRQLGQVATSPYFGLFHFLPGPLAWVALPPATR